MEKSIPVPDKYIRAGRKWIDKLNTGRMTVYNYTPIEKKDTGVTGFNLDVVLRDVPCRIAYQDKEAATKDEPAEANKSIRIVTSLDYKIPEGSILKVTYDGETEIYKQSGKRHRNDFRYSIPVEIFEEHVVSEIYEGEYEYKD